MENPAKKAKTSSVLPTSEEQRQLQQLEILMKNNLLNLQSKELIDQVDASSKLSGKKVSEFLSTLDADVKDTSKTSCHKRVLTTEWVQQQAGYEALQFNAYEEVSMEYRSPSELLTTGSFATNTCISPFYNIDILVTIPSKLIDTRDVLNHVYFDKRALFLAGLRKTLEKANKKNGEKYKVFSFEYLKGDVRKPVLSIVPSFSSSVVVRLIPVLPESCVKLVQLRPSKNNVRPRSWVEEIQRRKERGIVADAKEMDVSKLPPTPNYNAAILEDIVMPLHHQLLSRTVQSFEHIRGALMLLKVWLRQRQLVHSAIGFDTHTISLLLAYLVQTKRISTTAAPEIIFQTVLTFLTTFDAVTNVLDFTGTAFVPRTQLSSEDKTYTTPQGFMLRHPVSLQPPTGDNPIVVMYNVFWRVHDSSMTLLQNEATKALHDLTGSHRPGAFDRMFLQKRGFQDSFDQIFMLQVSSWSEVLNKVMYSVDTDEENGGGVPSFAEQRKDAIETASLHWPEKHQRKVERGPPAVPASEVSCCGESPAERAVREFKDFWGEQAQLRRFKDGSILESVVWEDAEFSPLAHDLIENIARYIVSRHLHAAVGDVYAAAAGDRHDSDDDDDDDEHLLGAVSRQGNFWAPSSKWPTDAAAIRKCKTAFLLKVKEELWSQSQVLSIIHEDSLDVLVQGYIFRVYPMATRYVIPPLHHNAMKSLHAAHPIFGETVKLMRLWLARHQFSGHLCQEAIECLVATEFLHPSTSMAPTTTSAAFLRTLQLLVDFNWDEEPLIVDYSLIAGVLTDEEKAKMATNPAAAAANLNAPLTTDVRTLIATRFRASKTAMESVPVLEMNPQQLIHPAMYVVTSVDKLTYRDVQAGPAFASTMLFANTGKNELDLSRLVVIANECRGHPVQAEVVQKLRDVFGPQALFFWDETDGAKVGILWRPRFTRPRPFAVMDCRYRTPLSKKTKKQNRKRKATAADSDEESDASDDDAGDNGTTEEAGDVLMQPHFDEIVEHVLVVAKGLLQRDAESL
eukprot:gene5401-3849_t